MKKPSSFERYFAYMIELLPSMMITAFPFAGPIVSTSYILFRDCFHGQSIGKRILRLQVVRLEDNKPAGVRESVLRNFPLAVTFFFSLIPVVGHVIGTVTGTLIFVLEAVSISTDRNGRRLGDKIAGTMVVRK